MNKTKYQGIIDYILKEINEGRLEVGMKLPSQRILAKKFGVNRTTIINVLDILKSYGVLESRERSGIYVANSRWNEYVHNNLSWQNYIGNSPTKNNQFYIQEINRCEFVEGIIRLGTGELSPELIPNNIFKEIINKDVFDQLSTNYEAPKGNILLREEVKRLANKRGIHCEVEEICITSGALQGLKLISDGLLIPKSKIIIESPSYINSIRTWHRIQSKIVPLSIDYIKNNINSIFKEDEDYSNSIFYSNPTLHNPTSNSYSLAEKESILKQCKAKGIPIVEDDIYSELWFNGDPPKSLKELDESNNVLYLGSLSKTVSPGLRIGWIIGNERVITHLADLKMQNDYGASSISQFVATQWLKYYHDKHIDKIKIELIHRKEIMENALNEYLGALGRWNKTEGSFYIWFKFNVKVDIKKLFQFSIQAGLLIHPGEIYSDKEKNSIRFSYSYIEKNKINSSIKKLREIIEKENLIY
ncbi:PLP-dependent aminotransferase family protein [Macrococcus carouselicus]|uniref:PLP-dependent aminotransferase family protein n=1 Tax=Macrococcus carouselicus TaxID=69969 RepID=A0A9Q8CJ12_9STAP|nr:PLP-dependent aminotransferase family protein [Macrococcus carouselicus]TDL94318.1 PLP-dependent aminotransferase family protein [Macrococcus carouselicus]